MRNAFADELTRLAEKDLRVVLLSGDIGNKLFDKFKEVDSKRFINCGIAEGNMMSVAAGLALSGMKPVVYTITPFTTTRCYEQIRVDACYHHAPVIIVGTGSGLSYAELGPTHHSLEDIAILRALPGITIFAPSDANELRAVMRKSLELEGPAYIRIGKKGEPRIYEDVPNICVGRVETIRAGKDVTMMCAGTMLPEALNVATALANCQVSAEVVSAHTVKPLDAAYLETATKKFKLLVTIEEHGLIGGLSGAVAEWRSATNSSIPHLAIGTPDEFMHEVGSQEYARQKYGLTSDSILRQIKQRLGL